jgi:ABC-type transporter Mla subunit MlaD
MDDKVNYTLVGAFVLGLGLVLVAGVLWLASGWGGQQTMDPYQAVIQESVAGLSLDAPVKYLGVDVGKVDAIAINPDNSQQVRLHFLVNHGTPIKTDSVAVLKTQGLTGIAYVELSGGSVDAPPHSPPGRRNNWRLRWHASPPAPRRCSTWPTPQAVPAPRPARRPARPPPACASWAATPCPN